MTTDNTSNKDNSNNYNRVVTQLNDDTFESDTSAESQTHSTGKNKDQGDLSGEAAGVVRGVS
eukprot:684872-Ditylum_brightwellii.AAC.1